MTITTMDDLFVDTLKDIYYAEKQILGALPKMVKKADSLELQQALEKHRKETEGQIERIEQIFDQLKLAKRGKKCEAIEGILREAEEVMGEIKSETVLDAGIVGSAQTVEHYEIARYGALIAWGKELGLKDAIPLLQETLEQEKNADATLTKIAQSAVNKKAA